MVKSAEQKRADYAAKAAAEGREVRTRRQEPVIVNTLTRGVDVGVQAGHSCEFRAGDKVYIKDIFHLMCRILPCDTHMRYELTRFVTRGEQQYWDLKCLSGSHKGKSYWIFLPAEALRH